VLPASPLERPDARLDVPVLVGTTRDEATFLFRTGGRDAPDDQVERVTRELFTAPTQRWARERAAAGGRVHLFRLDHPSPDPRLGALHTIDVPLLFGTFRTSEVGRHYVADDEPTRAVSAAMQRAWAAFLHGGEPWPQKQELCTVGSHEHIPC
jgi:para-nitrobenzyl esterase